MLLMDDEAEVQYTNEPEYTEVQQPAPSTSKNKEVSVKNACL